MKLKLRYKVVTIVNGLFELYDDANMYSIKIERNAKYLFKIANKLNENCLYNAMLTHLLKPVEQYKRYVIYAKLDENNRIYPIDVYSTTSKPLKRERLVYIENPLNIRKKTAL